MKIKLDENLSRYLKESLLLKGYDVETVFDEGLQGQPDVEIGAVIRREERMLLTLDVEFADLRKYSPGSHPGVILFRPRTMGPLTVNRFVIEFIQGNDLRQFARCVVIVDLERVRVRFPFQEYSCFQNGNEVSPLDKFW